MKVPSGALGPLFVALVWTIALTVGPGGLDPTSVFLICLGLLLNSTVAVVGMVVAGGRWAYRLGWVVLAAAALVAVVRPIDGWWWAGVAAMVVGGLGLVSVAPAIRQRPPAMGPGRRAVVVPLVLLWVPVAVGLTTSGPPWAALTVAISAVVTAFAYSRVIFGGLFAIRVLWPLLAILVGLFMVMPAGLVSIGLGVLVGVLAWDPSVKAAFHPLREVGSTFPIPPELTPKEILDAAEIDEQGRPM